jgi:hypothetical protein
MEKVYSFTMNVNGDNVVYSVLFDNEVYNFVPEDIHINAPSLQFKLENNHWIELQETDPNIKQQAISCLDQYLLSQH